MQPRLSVIGLYVRTFLKVTPNPSQKCFGRKFSILLQTEGSFTTDKATDKVMSNSQQNECLGRDDVAVRS